MKVVTDINGWRYGYTTYVTVDSASYSRGCKMSPVLFRPWSFTFWKIKYAEFAIGSSWLLCIIGCIDNCQGITLRLGKKIKMGVCQASSAVQRNIFFNDFWADLWKFI